MKKPHGSLRYMFALAGGGAFGSFDPFTDPDEFGNIVGLPGGVPPVPAMLTIWPLVNPGALGNFGQVTIFPSSIVFDPVTGNTLDVVLQVTNDSADFLVFFVGVNIPMVSDMGL